MMKVRGELDDGRDSKKESRKIDNERSGKWSWDCVVVLVAAAALLGRIVLVAHCGCVLLFGLVQHVLSPIRRVNVRMHPPNVWVWVGP